MPFSAIYWPAYEILKLQFVGNMPKFEATFLAGAIAGSIASTLTLPMDVVKTRYKESFYDWPPVVSIGQP